MGKGSATASVQKGTGNPVISTSLLVPLRPEHYQGSTYALLLLLRGWAAGAGAAVSFGGTHALGPRPAPPSG